MPSRVQYWYHRYPDDLVRGLAHLLDAGHPELYLTGGALRDLLLGNLPHDLDFVVAHDPLGCVRALRAELGGTLVTLDEAEGVYRLVWQEYLLDFARFRERTASIEKDLGRRDFTINALALPVQAQQGTLWSPTEIIDPTGGRRDLAAACIRATSREVFSRDPLRLLRAHRFAALLGFSLEEATRKWLIRYRALVAGVSAERVAYELRLIMESPRAAATMARLAQDGLLWEIFPELQAGVAMAQPASHHLDVFSHNLATLVAMEEVQQCPEEWFGGQGPRLRAYLEENRLPALLRWAALFHDLGKPASRGRKGERITFYNHDRLGAECFLGIARRLRWSKEESRRVARWIELHMWPFHLNNARQKTGITARACLRLVKAAGADLPGLFLLAMADTMAGQGVGRPEAAEQTLASLYEEVEKTYRQSIRPVLEAPRLLDGHQLQQRFGLRPGPFLGLVLAELEKAQIGGEVASRSEAEEWVADFLQRAEPFPKEDESLVSSSLGLTIEKHTAERKA